MKRTSFRSMVLPLIVISAILAGTAVVAQILFAEEKPGQSLIDKAVPRDFGRRRAGDEDGPLKGFVEWQDRYRSGASERDKTDFWAAIAISPSTGKYASSCEYKPFDLADRAAREKCNAPDARTVVLCGNGWCALALGDVKPGKDFGWGVGWGYAGNRLDAERFALEACAQRTKNARIALCFCTNGIAY